MVISYKAGMVVGTANEKVWSQVAIVPITGGALWVVLSLRYAGESELLDPAEVGAELLGSLKTGLAIGEGKEDGLKEQVKEIIGGLGSELEVSVVAGKVKEGNLVIAGVGKAEAYVKRGQKFARVFAGGDEAGQVRGRLQAGDGIVLVTSELVEQLGVVALELSMDGKEGLESLAVRVHGEDDSSKMAAVLVRVEESESEIKRESERGGRVGKVLERMKLTIADFGKEPLKISIKQRKMNTRVGAILLILLVAGIALGVVRRVRTVKEENFVEMEAIVRVKLEESRAIADLNPERAKTLLQEAGGELGAYLAETEDEAYLARAAEIQAGIERTEKEIFKEEEIQVQTLVELEVIGEGVSQKMMAADNDGAVWFWGEEGLVGVSLSDRSSWSYRVDEGGEPKAIAVYEAEGYLVKGEGIVRVQEDGETELVVEPDELWGEIAEIQIFAGNIYLLDRGQGEIWKYPVLESGFGSRQRWFGKGISLDLSRVTDMTVDGDIWIVTETGKLERYSRGVPLEFLMEGFPAVEGSGMLRPMAVATDENRVYVLEAGARRVVVFEKESGRYEKQLVNSEFEQGEELVIEKGKGYVLTGGKVVEFGL